MDNYGREIYLRKDIGQVRQYLASQWSGCGAVPGAGINPSFVCGCAACPQARGEGCPVERPCSAIRPLTIPGYAAGPHGFDTYTWDSMPNIVSPWPLMANIPDRDVSLDPMDRNIWGNPTSGGPESGDPYQPWTYPLGAWP